MGVQRWMGAAHRLRRREVKKAAGIKEQGVFFFGSGHHRRRGREGGRREKMRSNRDLDSKTPRHNRLGFTPREPPRPHPSTSVKTITERRGAAGGEGLSLGIVPLHCVLCLASLLLTPSSCLQQLALKPLEIPGKGT